MKHCLLLILILFSSTSILGQTDHEYSDELLTTTFKAYKEVDFEFSYHMYSFVKERFLEHLSNSSSFSNPYDSLSKYIGIRHSLDGKVKTYSWGIRDTGCCHSTEIYAQYKTKNGDIKFLDLKGENYGGREDIFITDFQYIEIKKKPYYPILGSGTCCGGEHYSTVKVYEIKNSLFQESEAIFDREPNLFIGVNRSQPIRLKYSSEQKKYPTSATKLMKIQAFTKEKSLM